MSNRLLAGAINGVPAMLNVTLDVPNPITLIIADNGEPSSIQVATDGTGFHGVSRRVAIIGGTTAGRDHFPVRIRTPTGPFPVGPGSIGRQFGLNLRQMARWYYLVSRWQVHFEGSWTETSTSTTTPFSIDFDFAFATSDAPDFIDRPIVESDFGAAGDLSIPTGDIFINLSDLGTLTDPDVKNASVVGLSSSILEFSFVPNNTYMVGGLFYPFLFFELILQDGPLSSNTLILGNSIGLSNAGTFQIEGFTAPISYNAPPGYTIACNAIMTPFRFFEYATKAGLPVYSTSGLQLRNPLS